MSGLRARIASWLEDRGLDLLLRAVVALRGGVEDNVPIDMGVEPGDLPRCALCGEACGVNMYGPPGQTTTVRFVCPQHGGHAVQFDAPLDDAEVLEWLATYRPHGGWV